MAIEDKLSTLIFKKYSKLRRKGVTHIDAMKQSRQGIDELNNDISSLTEEFNSHS